MTHWLQRYNDAHRENFQREYPGAWASGHYTPAVTPKWKTANGLTRFVITYLLWTGNRATRISATGRLIDGHETTSSGLRLSKKKWIPGQTRRGAADVSSTIRGRSVMWEIKIGEDKASAHQLREQALERKAGGEYFFTSTPEEFFEQLDSLEGTSLI